MGVGELPLDRARAESFGEYAELTGEPEAVVLARSSIRGLREERFKRGLLAYLGGTSSFEAAGIAGVDRHTFLVRAADMGAIIGNTEPARLLHDLSRVAEVLGDERLAAAVARVSQRPLRARPEHATSTAAGCA